jgi:hypothetical protein
MCSGILLNSLNHSNFLSSQITMHTFVLLHTHQLSHYRLLGRWLEQ